MKRKHSETANEMKSDNLPQTSEKTVSEHKTKKETPASMLQEDTGACATENPEQESGPHGGAKTNKDNGNIDTTSTTSSAGSSRASTPCSDGTSSSSALSPGASYHREVPAESLLPSYLSGLVQHSHEDFFISPFFDPELIAQLMCEGFLPIASSRYLIPKLHKERCVIYPLQQPNAQKPIIHTPKSTKKKLKRFALTVNQDFDGVVKGCHEQHGVAWLYPPIVSSFKFIHEKTKRKNTISTKSDNDKAQTTAKAPTKGKARDQVNSQQGRGVLATLIPSNPDEKFDNKELDTCEVKLYSVEVWNQETGELAGGELGYTIGSIYTSLTGFSCEDSAGSVQLAALGKLLTLSGYEMWDLGMSLDYKITLGAENMDRMNFVNCVKALRVRSPVDGRRGGIELRCDEKVNCKEIFNMDSWNYR